jgi:hypothetical protein
LLPFSPEGAIKFLEEAAKYFSNRPVNGEDSAYWANVYNAEWCKRIAKYISEQ